MPRCTVVATGAPLAVRTSDLAACLQNAGFDVDLLATDSAREWVDTAAVSAATGARPRDEARPNAPRAPLPDAVVVCPATFNTINKLAVGIADTRVHGFLAECVAARLPVVLVPMINDRLWNHPALAAHLEMLSGVGATVIDVHGGDAPRAVGSGSGAAVIDAFDPDWVLRALQRTL